VSRYRWAVPRISWWKEPNRISCLGKHDVNARHSHWPSGTWLTYRRLGVYRVQVEAWVLVGAARGSAVRRKQTLYISH
jgi:hypothetical protein